MAIADIDTTKTSRDARGEAQARVDKLRSQLVDLEVAREKLDDQIVDVRATIYAEESLLRMLPATQGANGSMQRELEGQRADS